MERGLGAIAHGLHQRHGGEHRDGRLADRHHMHVSPEKPKKLNDVVDIVVEVEGAGRARHEAGVLPFGDIDLVMREEIAHRAAEKRREMPGHGRHDQDLGVLAAAPRRHLPLEIDEIAEGLRDQRALSDGDLAAAHLGLVDAPGGLAIAPRGALEQLERRRGAAAKGRVVGGIERIAEQQPIGVRRGPRRAQRRLVQLIEMVQACIDLPLRRLHVNAASRNQMVILCCSAMTTCRGG